MYSSVSCFFTTAVIMRLSSMSSTFCSSSSAWISIGLSQSNLLLREGDPIDPVFDVPEHDLDRVPLRRVLRNRVAHEAPVGEEHPDLLDRVQPGVVHDDHQSLSVVLVQLLAVLLACKHGQLEGILQLFQELDDVVSFIDPHPQLREYMAVVSHGANGGCSAVLLPDDDGVLVHVGLPALDLVDSAVEGHLVHPDEPAALTHHLEEEELEPRLVPLHVVSELAPLHQRRLPVPVVEVFVQDVSHCSFFDVFLRVLGRDPASEHFCGVCFPKEGVNGLFDQLDLLGLLLGADFLLLDRLIQVAGLPTQLGADEGVEGVEGDLRQLEFLSDPLHVLSLEQADLDPVLLLNQLLLILGTRQRLACKLLRVHLPDFVDTFLVDKDALPELLLLFPDLNLLDWVLSGEVLDVFGQLEDLEESVLVEGPEVHHVRITLHRHLVLFELGAPCGSFELDMLLRPLAVEEQGRDHDALKKRVFGHI